MSFFRFIDRLKNARSGSLPVITAFVAPVLMATTAFGIDFYAFNNHKKVLQQAADGAALASVREAALQGWSEKTAAAVAENYVFANLENGMAGRTTYEVKTEVSEEGRTVEVTVTQDHYPYFASFAYPSPQIVTSAVATADGQANVCVIGLMKPQKMAKASVHMDDSSVIVADNCAIYSNSTDRYGLRVDSNAEMYAQSICSAGGVWKLFKTIISPLPLTDCPELEDPLQNRPEPSFATCDFTSLEVTTSGMLKPGVYCGGLSISNGAEIDLAPGTYVIKDGTLVVGGGAAISGEEVSFFLTGEDSRFDFQSDSTIDISAPETGASAGILISESVDVPYSFDFNPFLLKNIPDDVRVQRISSNNARNLLGTLYLPRSILLVNANAPVADSSAYTAIVTGRLWLKEGPTLTLNSDYAATDVPVPDGIGPTDGHARLVE